MAYPKTSLSEFAGYVPMESAVWHLFHPMRLARPFVFSMIGIKQSD